MAGLTSLQRLKDNTQLMPTSQAIVVSRNVAGTRRNFLLSTSQATPGSISETDELQAASVEWLCHQRSGARKEQVSIREDGRDTCRQDSLTRLTAGIDVERLVTEGVLLLERVAANLPRRSPERRTIEDAVTGGLNLATRTTYTADGRVLTQTLIAAAATASTCTTLSAASEKIAEEWVNSQAPIFAASTSSVAVPPTDLAAKSRRIVALVRSRPSASPAATAARARSAAARGNSEPPRGEADTAAPRSRSRPTQPGGSTPALRLPVGARPPAGPPRTGGWPAPVR